MRSQRLGRHKWVASLYKLLALGHFDFGSDRWFARELFATQVESLQVD